MKLKNIISAATTLEKYLSHDGNTVPNVRWDSAGFDEDIDKIIDHVVYLTGVGKTASYVRSLIYTNDFVISRKITTFQKMIRWNRALGENNIWETYIPSIMFICHCLDPAYLRSIKFTNEQNQETAREFINYLVL